MKNYSPPLQSTRMNNIVLNNSQIESTLALESTHGNNNPFGEDAHAGHDHHEEVDDTKKKLYTLINNCNNLQKHTIRNLNKLEVQR